MFHFRFKNGDVEEIPIWPNAVNPFFRLKKQFCISLRPLACVLFLVNTPPAPRLRLLLVGGVSFSADFKHGGGLSPIPVFEYSY
jgi:hypothetical protein